jgi:phosphoribosyl-ATP pyrophosphohydrolase
MSFTIETLDATIAARAGSTAEKSYTKSLLDRGAAHCARKFGEEAVEAVIAAVEGDRAALVKEAGDVLFHLLVLLRASGAGLSDVMAELEARTAQSGHAEKAARPKA